jgi:hypothetical protein
VVIDVPAAPDACAAGASSAARDAAAGFGLGFGFGFDGGVGLDADAGSAVRACVDLERDESRGPDGWVRPVGPRLVVGMPPMVAQAEKRGNADAPE